MASIDSNTDFHSNRGFSIRRFSVAEYHRLAEVGILGESDRIELLEGLLSPKMIHSPKHDATVSIIEYFLRPKLSAGWMLRIQSAITLDDSEPEPDIVVTQGPPTRYANQHPHAFEISQVIEVAESSLARDRAKAEIYAAAGISHYWIVNLKDRQLEVFQKPSQGRYEHCHVITTSQHVGLTSLCYSEERIPVTELFLQESIDNS